MLSDVEQKATSMQGVGFVLIDIAHKVAVMSSRVQGQSKPVQGRQQQLPGLDLCMVLATSMAH